MMKEKNRKITVHDTTMEYTGVSPIEITEEPHTNSTDRAEPAQIEALGVRCRGDTRASDLEKGRPPSPGKANIRRRSEVPGARPAAPRAGMLSSGPSAHEGPGGGREGAFASVSLH